MSKYINEKFFPSVIKSAFASLIVALLGVLILAFVIKISSLPSSVVGIVVMFLKIISIFIGCFLSLKGKNGLFRGAFSGVLFAIISYSVFSLVCGYLLFNKAFFIDLFVCVIVGAISGVIAINLGKTNE